MKSTGIHMMLDALKMRVGYPAVAAFILHLGILSLFVKKGKVMHSMENKKRLNVAYENYGLKN